MPLVAAAMSSQLSSILAGSGWVGPEMPSFSQAIGSGVITSLIGTSFQTQESGASVAPGVGTGVGVTGVSASAVEGLIFSEALAAGMISTPDLAILTNAIGVSLVSQLSLGSLSLESKVIATGLAVIVPGSFAVSASKISSSIFQTGFALGFIGEDFQTICDAIGSGVEKSFASATGQLSIVGTPPTPPVPVSPPGVPGVGVLN